MDALRLYQLRNFINILFQSLQEKKIITRFQGPLSFSSFKISFIFRHYHGEFVSLVETKLNN